MNRLLNILFLLFLLNCSNSNESLIETDNHLQYFGFAITDCGTNYTSQVDDFVNLIDMCPTDFGSMEQRVNANIIGNNKALIHLQGLFINNIPDSSSPSGFRYELFSNYEEQFNLWKDNNTFITNETVAAFDFADEPAWNQMNMQDLATVAALIKSAFPDIPIMVIEAPDLIDDLILTDDIDWIGFDRYGTLDPKNDSEYLSLLNLIKSKRTNTNQKLVIIMESQWLDFYTQAGFDESILTPMASSYYELAKSEEDVIALISYLLPGGFDTPDQKGFLDLEQENRATIEAIGREISN